MRRIWTLIINSDGFDKFGLFIGALALLIAFGLVAFAFILASIVFK